MSELAYRLRAITRRYGAREVLNVAELDIERGEVLCLVGPSGAGKSTLLRILGFLETPSSGELTCNGAAVRGEPGLEVRRRVTMVFQRPILLHGTVTYNVNYGLR
ncbi:MAG: ATP-binding cassette domain-containing protein, partial [Chloroflexi bacterium]|nr:ATP-binding cassette domain-containing protein [Chloroflexota bacterium]